MMSRPQRLPRLARWTAETTALPCRGAPTKPAARNLLMVAFPGAGPGLSRRHHAACQPTSWTALKHRTTSRHSAEGPQRTAVLPGVKYASRPARPPRSARSSTPSWAGVCADRRREALPHIRTAHGHTGDCSPINWRTTVAPHPAQDRRALVGLPNLALLMSRARPSGAPGGRPARCGRHTSGRRPRSRRPPRS